jgi:nucleotide-binding universal stress UspA family protein
MLELKRILYPTDFSPCAEQALPHAVALARRFGAELHLLHALILHGYDPNNPELSFPEPEQDLQERFSASVADHLSRLVKTQVAGQLVVHRVQRKGISAGQVILEYAGERDIDLIVMGTHGRRGLRHLFLGSVAEDVIRHAGCPVLTVHEQEKPQPEVEITRILVPIDFSDYSRQALVHAKGLARILGARLQLLHVIEQTVHPAFYSPGRESYLDLAPGLKADAKDELDRLLTESPGEAPEAELHVVEGHAHQQIVQFAVEHGSQLIVIATHGLAGLEHLLLGSTTEKVIRQATCPVFTVRPFGKSLLRK